MEIKTHGVTDEGAIIDATPTIEAVKTLLLNLQAFGKVIERALEEAAQSARDCPDYVEGHEHMAALALEGVTAAVIDGVFGAAHELSRVMGANGAAARAAAKAAGIEIPDAPDSVPEPTVSAHGRA